MKNPHKIELILLELEEKLDNLGKCSLDDIPESEIKYLRWRFLVLREQFSILLELYASGNFSELLNQITRVKTGLSLFQGHLNHAQYLANEGLL
jgi:hypothetical protein